MGASANGGAMWMNPTLDGVLDDNDSALTKVKFGLDNVLGVGDVGSLMPGDVSLDGRVDVVDTESIE